jgi:hypothetical protein
VTCESIYMPLLLILCSYMIISVALILQPKLLDEKSTTIYKRAVDKNYHLKMKSSRFIFSEINQKFPIMPFTARFISYVVTQLFQSPFSLCL